jgi:hypothetical protein
MRQLAGLADGPQLADENLRDEPRVRKWGQSPGELIDHLAEVKVPLHAILESKVYDVPRYVADRRDVPEESESHGGILPLGPLQKREAGSGQAPAFRRLFAADRAPVRARVPRGVRFGTAAAGTANSGTATPRTAQ